MLTFNEIDKGVRAVRARGIDTRSLTAMELIPGGIGQFVSPLVLNQSPYERGVSDITQGVALLARVGADDPLIVFGKRNNYESRGISSSVNLGGAKLDPSIAGSLNGIIIGTGAAGLITGRVLRELGFKQITFLSPDANPGGLWRPDEGIWGENKPVGYNNPSGVEVFNAYFDLTPQRKTRVIQRFLEKITTSDMRANTVNGTATGIDFDGTSHTIFYKDDAGQDKELPPASFVIAATGNIPLPLTEGYMLLNIPETLQVRRWPNLMTEAEARRLHENNQKILCIGWGNSTMAKIREVERLKSKGINIDVVVLSHLPRYTIDHPFQDRYQSDGKLRRLARTTRGDQIDLTRLELDLDESYDLFHQYKDEQLDPFDHVVSGTISDVDACEIVENNGIYNARITAHDRFGNVLVKFVPNIGEIDTFIGYGNDPSLMSDFGLELTDRYRGIVAYRPFDSRAITADGRKVHVAGAAAYSRDDPSARVLPGIVRNAKEIGLTAIYEAALASE